MDKRPRSVEQWNEYTVFVALPRHDLREPTLIIVREEGREFAIRNLRRVPRAEERIRVLSYRDWADVLRIVKIMSGDEVLYDDAR